MEVKRCIYCKCFISGKYNLCKDCYNFQLLKKIFDEEILGKVI